MLDALWIALVALEVALVLGVMVRGVAARLAGGGGGSGVAVVRGGGGGEDGKAKRL